MAKAEVKLAVTVVGVRSDHEAIQAALGELLADLKETPELRPALADSATTTHGKKGAAVELVVSVAASGSLASLARMLHLWLSRDKRRAITVTVASQANEKILHISGDNVSIGTLDAALRSASGFDREPVADES